MEFWFGSPFKEMVLRCYLICGDWKGFEKQVEKYATQHQPNDEGGNKE